MREGLSDNAFLASNDIRIKEMRVGRTRRIGVVCKSSIKEQRCSSKFKNNRVKVMGKESLYTFQLSRRAFSRYASSGYRRLGCVVTCLLFVQQTYIDTSP